MFVGSGRGAPGEVALALDNPVIPNASVNTPVITARAILLEPNNGVVVRKGVFMSVSSLL
jgi:hypothetical protein